jgi:hypothetical protein
METLIGVAISAIIFAAISWPSVRAKPLASKRFRWGTFVGWYSGLWAFGMPYLYYFSGFPNRRILSFMAGCCYGIASYGILHRRKYGVIMFAVAFLLVVLLQLRGLNLSTVAHLILPTSYSVVSLVYFGRRWSLLVPQPVALKETVIRGAEIESSK